MKKTLMAAGLAICMAMLAQEKIYAQTLIPPSISDNLWLSGAPASGINTALIDVVGCNNNECTKPFLKQLGACAYDGGSGGGGGVVVTDFATGWQVNVTFPFAAGSGLSVVGTPDVILGNLSGSVTDCIMAVAFANSGAGVEIDYFNIHYISLTAFTVTFNSYQAMVIPAGYYVQGTVHLDVVAKSSIPIPQGTGLPSLPFCNTFFMTYDLNDGTNPYYVMGTYGSLNTYNALIQGPLIINFPVFTCDPFTEEAWQPDVAGIERKVSGAYDDIGCFTYVMPPDACGLNNAIFYSEWDEAFTSTTCQGLQSYVRLDGNTAICTADPGFAHPRIDANDDYNTNSGISCQSKVVCEYFPASSSGSLVPEDVHIYSPLLASSPGRSLQSWDNSFTVLNPFYPVYILDPYGYYCPTVAFGQNGGSEFMVNTCTNVPGLGDFFVMSPMDMYNSGSCTSPGGDVSYYGTAQNYFAENLSYPAASTNNANAVSTPCNNVTDASLVAFTNNGNIYYKLSAFGGTNGYSYRQAPGGAAVAATGKISVYPNPADDMLTVSNVDGLADGYSITNMLGQRQLMGSLAAGTQQVNVSSLAPGSYVVSFNKDGAPAGNNIFVKK